MLLSCKSRVYEVTNYFEVENLTSHQVKILFYNKYAIIDNMDTILLKECIIPAILKALLTPLNMSML